MLIQALTPSARQCLPYTNRTSPSDSQSRISLAQLNIKTVLLTGAAHNLQRMILTSDHHPPPLKDNAYPLCVIWTSQRARNRVERSKHSLTSLGIQADAPLEHLLPQPIW